jgi:hypothetical protein
MEMIAKERYIISDILQRLSTIHITTISIDQLVFYIAIHGIVVLEMDLVFGFASIKLDEFEDKSFLRILWISDEVEVGHEWVKGRR